MYTSKWPHFEKLKFPNDFITAKQSVSNFKVIMYKHFKVIIMYIYIIIILKNSYVSHYSCATIIMSAKCAYRQKWLVYDHTIFHCRGTLPFSDTKYWHNLSRRCWAELECRLLPCCANGCNPVECGPSYHCPRTM